MKGHGVKPKNGSAGDLLAEIQIVLPKGLNEADRQEIRQIDEHYAQIPARRFAVVTGARSGKRET